MLQMQKKIVCKWERMFFKCFETVHEFIDMRTSFSAETDFIVTESDGELLQYWKRQMINKRMFACRDQKASTFSSSRKYAILILQARLLWSIWWRTEYLERIKIIFFTGKGKLSCFMASSEFVRKLSYLYVQFVFILE